MRFNVKLYLPHPPANCAFLQDDRGRRNAATWMAAARWLSALSSPIASRIELFAPDLAASAGVLVHSELAAGPELLLCGKAMRGLNDCVF